MMPPAAIENQYCCSLRMLILIIAILLFVDFLRQLIYLTEIIINPYFSVWYGVGYALGLCIMVTAIVFICIYLFGYDSRENRKFAPWAFLLAAVASFLLALWVFIYIETVYQEDIVRLPHSLQWDIRTKMFAEDNEPMAEHGDEPGQTHEAEYDRGRLMHGDE